MHLFFVGLHIGVTDAEIDVGSLNPVVSCCSLKHDSIFMYSLAVLSHLRPRLA